MGRRNKVKPKQVKRAYVDIQEITRLKNDYITNLINGRYFFARYNMLAEQIIAKKITEKIDGRIKSEEYTRSEAALMKLRAIASYRTSHFSKMDLIKNYKFTEKDLVDIQYDYYNGKIVREEYDESYKKHNKAEFIKHNKKTKS